MGCIPSSESNGPADHNHDAAMIDTNHRNDVTVKEEGRHAIPGPIKTIVVLVMENRSFDHMLGWQKELHPEIDGVTGRESNPIDGPGGATSVTLVPFTKGAKYVSGDPGHTFQAVRVQLFGSDDDTSPGPPPMNGFAKQAETIAEGFSRTVMAGFEPRQLPIYTSLIDEYCLIDRWFASVPSSTQPNRQYVHSATSHGLNTTTLNRELLQGLPQATIFDSLSLDGLSFGIYFQSLPSTLYYRRLRQLKYLGNFHPFDLSFKKHAHEGTLPNYVVIEPRYLNHEIPPANDDHPPHDVSRGQAFVKEVYETLRASPQWEEMLILITYDEHGGFYDHVPTPTENVPNPDGIDGPEPYYFKFNRLGVRVPTFLVSPWIDKGRVIHTPNGPTPSSQFEHSSIPATVKKLFNLSSDFLTKRDAWAATFEHVITRSTPRTDCPETLPTVIHDDTETTDFKDEEKASNLSEFQEELVLLATHLKGDERVDVEKGMSVKEAAIYVDNAWKSYRDVCHKAKEDGVDISSIVRVKASSTPDEKSSYLVEKC